MRDLTQYFPPEPEPEPRPLPILHKDASGITLLDPIGGEYPIEVGRYKTDTMVLLWVYHLLATRTWVTREHILAFIEATTDVTDIHLRCGD